MSHSRLEGMRANPAGDWTIEVLCEPARGGSSHYKVAHSNIAEKLTVPYKRPIKAIYIRKLVALRRGR